MKIFKKILLYVVLIYGVVFCVGAIMEFLTTYGSIADAISTIPVFLLLCFLLSRVDRILQ